ncbi:MAG: DUF1343 domain-containing protein [Chloroflexi bacterium]|nr:DUF1343 domain-containing protein [Chloroflexota bacterium]
MMPDRIAFQTGLDVLIADDFGALMGKRIGLLTNPSAVDQHLRSTYDIFHRSEAVNLAALFGPEHGFMGAAADGEQIGAAVDSRTGLPIHSLYGATYRPTAAMLAGLDAIVCDLQDVGARFYTYIWTIAEIMAAAGEHGVEVIVLDRPNPLGGRIIEGGPLDPALASLVGRGPLPIRHGLTVGELARLINAVLLPKRAHLTVIPCVGWSRDLVWPALGRPWIAPSPNIHCVEALLHYPGACLLEGTNLSEGRGTAQPFQWVGAPWIDGPALADHLNQQGWPGVRFRACAFQPTASKWAGQVCHGVQAHITDTPAWQPVRAWLGVIAAIRRLYPDDFAWLAPTDPAGDHHFDRLIGSRTTRSLIDSGAPLAALMIGWDAFCAEFDAQRQPYMLYRERPITPITSEENS